MSQFVRGSCIRIPTPAITSRRCQWGTRYTATNNTTVTHYPVQFTPSQGANRYCRQSNPYHSQGSIFMGLRRNVKFSSHKMLGLETKQIAILTCCISVQSLNCKINNSEYSADCKKKIAHKRNRLNGIALYIRSSYPSLSDLVIPARGTAYQLQPHTSYVPYLTHSSYNTQSTALQGVCPMSCSCTPTACPQIPHEP